MAKFSTKSKKLLPDKPSELIRVAIHDLTLVERQKDKYVVDMGTFHEGRPNAKCRVCYAGAVMAKTLKAPQDKDVTTNSWDEDTDQKLDALDAFRTGNIYDGFNFMGVDKPDIIGDNTTIVGYHVDPTKFKKQQINLANILELAGV